jgi:hypothetical protein
MDWVLQKKFNAATRKAGKAQYEKLKEILPSLFENEIKG